MTQSPLLLLHGALGSSKQFAPLKNALRHEFDLYELDFEGHGGRESNRPFSIQGFTANVEAYVQEHSLSRLNIFGYSMGGYVALNVARHNPAWVNRIITLGTKFDWTPEAAEKEIRMLNPEKILAKVPHFAEQLRQAHAPVDWKEVMRKTSVMMQEMGAGAKLSIEDFAHIQSRVILGLGEKDRMVSLAETQLVSQALPNSEVVSLPDVPHPIDQIDPQLLASYIKNHLN